MYIHVVDDKVDRLDDVLEVCLSLRNCQFLTSVWHIAPRFIIHGHPSLERWGDSFVDKILDRWVICNARPLNETEFAQISRRVDKILHLIHHDLIGVIITVEAENPQFLWLLLFESRW